MPYTSKESLQTMDKPKFLWTRRKIYDMILSKIGHATKCYIDTKSTVAKLFFDTDLMDAYLENNGALTKKLITQLSSIESAFRIKIYASYTLDDIASIAEWALEKQGRLESVDSQIDAIAKAKPTPKARSK